MKREMLKQCYYNISRKSYLYNTDANLVDIDTEDDFKLASLAYKHYIKSHQPAM